jgi:multicomponent Na+:H+ antiporter subunit B
VAAIYLCARGFSPGGGFPAGAALSGVGMLLYAALGYRAVAPVLRPQVLEPVEIVGAAVIVGLAVAGWFLRGSVMANWIPLAPVGTIASGGLLQAFSVMELVEVATGLSIAVFTMLAMRHDWTPDEQGGQQQKSGDGRHHDGEPGGEGSR